MEIALLVFALIVSFVIFTWLIKVVKATITTAFTIALIVLALQILFGLGPQDIVQAFSDFWRRLWQIISGGA